MTASDAALLDTNVLVFSLDKKAAEYAAARLVTRLARKATANLYVAPQNLSEFYAVLTSAKRTRQPRTPKEAVAAVEKFLAMPGLTLLQTPSTVVGRWMELVRRREVRGAKIFDLQLVATMLEAGITRIYTFNRDDFTPFSELEVLTPTVGALKPSPVQSGSTSRE
jgi:predicted nucleic acid-binding protein